LRTHLARPAPLTLLVDRDSDTRELYGYYLTAHGQRVSEANDGRQALAKAITELPDFIVTETRLDGFDGYRLCELLRSDRDTSLIPIIILSGDARPDDVARAKAAGADSVLAKPCLPERLFAEMRQLRERGRDVRARSVVLRAQAEQVIQKSSAALARASRLNKMHERYSSTVPPQAPPALMCPVCENMLKYDRSFVGGVNGRQPEQWDYFECSYGCGRFQYRHRTRKIRKTA
jgi:CheY-like chemotaxis protein